MVPRLRFRPGCARAAAVAALAALLAFSGVAAPVQLLPRGLRPDSVLAAVSSGYLSEGRAPVAPGVQHDWGTIQTTRSGRQAVNLLEVDLGAPEISLESSLAGDRITRLETTTSQALRASREGHRAVAAINGDVWSGYASPTQFAPNGIDIHAGELVTAAAARRPTFGIDTAGHPLIGNVLESVTLTWPDGSTSPIEHVNQARTDYQFALYTPRFGPTTAEDVGGTDVVLAGVTLPLAPTGVHQAVVREVRAALGGIPIAPDTVVLNGPSGWLIDALKPGDSLSIALSIAGDTPGWENVREAIGGREFIVRDGTTSISPHPAIADQLHPRTALGITAAGGVVMAAVDGRQSGVSGGVDLNELAALMLSRGVVQALNMDGGGSTTMAVRRPGDVDVSLANRPSGGREVGVANSLIVFSSAPTGPLATVNVLPAASTLWQGEGATFTATGQDAAYNGIVLGEGEVGWDVAGPGAIAATGRYTATAPGEATVAATARGVRGTATVTVRADTFPPVVRPPTSSLVAATTLDPSTIPVSVTWPAGTDEGRGITGYELQRQSGPAWVDVPIETPADTSATVMLAPAAAHRFRVRAVDRAGNVSAWATAPAFRLLAVQERSAAVVRKGHWAIPSSPAYFGTRAISSKVAGASARIRFTGQQIAWVSAVGPTRGEARIYVDGAYERTVDLRSAAVAARRIIVVRSWAASGPHVLEIRVVGTPGRPRVDVDAFLVTAPAP